ncbi:hypothetical protein [Parafrankia discariae]|uniref:hypothetical protein n=1 Tax=Parafrankia discariae TaxID=365528 RepID=UPI0003AA3F6A|nr:hypothetical protein [Parafrankia discariae]
MRGIFDPDVERALLDHRHPLPPLGDLDRNIRDKLIDVIDGSANWKARGYTGPPGGDDIGIWARDFIEMVTGALARLDHEHVTAAAQAAAARAISSVLTHTVRNAITTSTPRATADLPAPPAEIEVAARRLLWVENNLSAPVKADIELIAGWVLAGARGAPAPDGGSRQAPAPVAAEYRPRPWTEDTTTPTGAQRITVKRACNGCGLTLGDISPAELDAAVTGRPLPDVRDECPTCLRQRAADAERRAADAARELAQLQSLATRAVRTWRAFDGVSREERDTAETALGRVRDLAAQLDAEAVARHHGMTGAEAITVRQVVHRLYKAIGDTAPQEQPPAVLLVVEEPLTPGDDAIFRAIAEDARTSKLAIRDLLEETSTLTDSESADAPHNPDVWTLRSYVDQLRTAVRSLLDPSAPAREWSSEEQVRAEVAEEGISRIRRSLSALADKLDAEARAYPNALGVTEAAAALTSSAQRIRKAINDADGSPGHLARQAPDPGTSEHATWKPEIHPVVKVLREDVEWTDFDPSDLDDLANLAALLIEALPGPTAAAQDEPVTRTRLYAETGDHPAIVWARQPEGAWWHVGPRGWDRHNAAGSPDTPVKELTPLGWVEIQHAAAWRLTHGPAGAEEGPSNV